MTVLVTTYDLFRIAARAAGLAISFWSAVVGRIQASTIKRRVAVSLKRTSGVGVGGGSDGEGSQRTRSRTKCRSSRRALLAVHQLLLVVHVLALVEVGVALVLLVNRVFLALILSCLRIFVHCLADVPITRISKNALRALVVFFLPHPSDDACPQEGPCPTPGLVVACAPHCTEILSRHFPNSRIESWPVFRFLVHSGPGLPSPTHYETTILSNAASLLPKHFDASRPSRPWPILYVIVHYCCQLRLLRHGYTEHLGVTLKYPASVMDTHASRLAFLMNVLEVHHVRSTSYYSFAAMLCKRHLHRYDAFVPDWMRQDPAFKPSWVPRAYKRCCGCTVWEWRCARGALICLQHRWHVDMSVVEEVKWAIEKGLI